MEGFNHSVTQTVLITTTSNSNLLIISNSQTYSTAPSFNNVTTEEVSFWFPGESSPYTITEAIIIALVLLFIIVGTVVGNILVCVAVCLVKKLRRPCNYLLVSLAVSDICVALLVMPMATLQEILGKWTLGPIMCDLWVSFDVLSCTASILNLCMISVDRYYAITKPLQYGVKRTPKRMILCVSLVWLGAACISLPPLLILGNQHEKEQCIVCQYFGYQIYATLGSFYIPLTVMMIVYYKIFRAARRIVLDERQSRSHLESHCYLEISVRNGGCVPVTQSISSSPAASTPAIANRVQQHHRSSTASTVTTCSGHTNISTRCFPRSSNESQLSTFRGNNERENVRQTRNNNRHIPTVTTRKKSAANLIGTPSQKRIRFQLAKERKASTTLGIIMSAFTVCWLPFFVLALIRPFLSNPSSIPPSLSSLFLWLGYANSLLNPIIYATLNRDFRKPFQQILYFKCSSLNDMMREEFYHSQYGDPHYTVINNSNVNPDRTDDVTAANTTNNESFL